MRSRLCYNKRVKRPVKESGHFQKLMQARCVL